MVATLGRHPARLIAGRVLHYTSALTTAQSSPVKLCLRPMHVRNSYEAIQSRLTRPRITLASDRHQ